ncbi:uncharacterized protein FIBRA_08177 [Fibroporia radiculosa]|uniref:Fibronectin type-III domain-containing protein n=1 Tax=Fibroporia radiculosa TaxID=599839 RepID=J4GGQ5_9APHY|nr:uncharacterized protein FIBRA_08177 [Fibroporia radiculosa]CCM05938.1 predicted protein [Fibroporia radiculosa]
MYLSMIYVLSFLLLTARAIPVRPQARDVVDPPVTNPTADTVWNVGQTVTVTWNTSVIPPSANLTNPEGMVVLGYSTWQNENLMIDTPLAQGFPLTAGQVSFVVPSVQTRTNYIVALFGDSGNISPNFTIIGTSAPSSPSSNDPTTTDVSSIPSLTAAQTSTALMTTTVTSEAVTTVPGTTSTNTVIRISSPTSKGTSSVGSTTTSNTSASAHLPTSIASTPSSSPFSPATSGATNPTQTTTMTTTTSSAWSWAKGGVARPWSIAIISLVAFVML